MSSNVSRVQEKKIVMFSMWSTNFVDQLIIIQLTLQLEELSMAGKLYQCDICDKSFKIRNQSKSSSLDFTPYNSSSYKVLYSFAIFGNSECLEKNPKVTRAKIKLS